WFAAKGHLRPASRLIGRRLAARPSLRAGRKFSSTRKIACPIDHNTIHIKWLDAQIRTRAAGSRGMLLREAAGRICVAIFAPLSDQSCFVINTRYELLK